MKDNGFILLSKEYKIQTDYLTYMDSVGYKYYQRFADFSRGCRQPYIAKSNPFTLHNMKIYFQQHNIYLDIVSKEYDGKN